jgi:hypothetical protein
MEFDKAGQPVREGFQSATGGAQPQPRVMQNGGAAGTGPIIDATPTQEPQVASPPPVDQFPITVKLLYRPILGNNREELTSLTFREPTGGDINHCGNPCRVNSDGDVVIDEKKMSLIMANLSGVLSPLLDRMDPRDWNSCAYRLRNFFLPDLRAW